MAKDRIREGFAALKTGDEVQPVRDLTAGHLMQFNFFADMREGGFSPGELDNSANTIFSAGTKMKVSDINAEHGSKWVQLERDTYPATYLKLAPEEFVDNFESHSQGRATNKG